jgi:surfactin synthase thioesterase subunit
MRMFCFPYAGAAASAFRLWPAGLPEEVDVCAIQLPGRANRLRERPITSIPEMVEAVVDAMADHLDRPFVLFGHSMGGLLAFEVAHELAARGWSTPRHLIISARRAPLLRDPSSLLHVLPDAEFVDEIQRRYGGIPEEILAHQDVLALLLPCLRADITALETHRPPQRVPLGCPLSVFAGAEDRHASPAHVAGWRRETTGAFDTRIFPGGHFYLDAQRPDVLADLSARLAPVIGVAQQREPVQ